MDELETYQQKSQRESVLLFPILPSRLRYLIHKAIEDLPELTTFSVGESWCRRVAVCHSELRAELEEDANLGNSSEEPLRRREEVEGVPKPKSSTPSRSQGQKRPDKPLYMPRAARERLFQQTSKQSAVCKELSSPASSSCSCIGSSSDSCSCCEPPESIKLFRDESLPIVGHITEDSSVCCRLEEKQKVVLHEDEPHEWDQTVSSFTAMSLEAAVKDEEDLARSVPYCTKTEDKSTDADDVTAEIKAHLKEAVSFFIEHVHSDFSIYETVAINPDEFRHVIEIYDFPAVFKTDDLLDAFSSFSDGGMKIKWVDNTHALGIFSSDSAALHALSICHPLLKTRALADGSKQSKGKAIRRAEFIQPVKERPRTDCAVARRMVTRALGLRGQGRVLRY